MRLSEYVCESIAKIEAGEHNKALVWACLAVGITASKEHPNEKDNKATKDFLHDNLWIITLPMDLVGPNILIRVPHPQIRPDANGYCTLEQALYHVVRCGVVHTDTSHNDFVLSDSVSLGYDGAKYHFGRGMVVGLLFTAMLSTTNSNETCPGSYWLGVDGHRFPLNEWWGKKAEFSAHFARKFAERMAKADE